MLQPPFIFTQQVRELWSSISEIAPDEAEIYLSILDWQRRAVPETLRSLPTNEKFNLACSTVFQETMSQFSKYVIAEGDSFVIVNSIMLQSEINIETIIDKIIEALYNTPSTPKLFQRRDSSTHNTRRTT